MEKVVKFFLNNKIEKLEGRDCLLFTYHHATTIVLHQLSSFIDLENPHQLLELLQLLLTICIAYKPFVVVTYCLQHM